MGCSKTKKGRLWHLDQNQELKSRVSGVEFEGAAPVIRVATGLSIRMDRL